VSEKRTREDRFENELFYFHKALQILAMEAEDQCEVMGNYNTAWEMLHDISGPIPFMVKDPASHLTEAQSAALVRLSDAMKEIPQEGLFPDGFSPTSHEGCLAAMRHPSWAPLRIQASELLNLLKPAMHRNAAYFA
jgi:hypothetical protein